MEMTPLWTHKRYTHKPVEDKWDPFTFISRTTKCSGKALGGRFVTCPLEKSLNTQITFHKQPLLWGKRGIWTNINYYLPLCSALKSSCFTLWLILHSFAFLGFLIQDFLMDLANEGRGVVVSVGIAIGLLNKHALFIETMYHQLLQRCKGRLLDLPCPQEATQGY